MHIKYFTKELKQKNKSFSDFYNIIKFLDETLIINNVMLQI